MSSYYSNEWLRPLPLMFGALVFLLFAWYDPNSVEAIFVYLSDSNPEEHFEIYGWKLYCVIIPCCIAGLTRPSENLPITITLLLAPVALFLSYWLWELLGWVVIAIYLVIVVIAPFMKKNTDPYDTYLVVAIIAGVIYAFMRIVGGIYKSEWLGLADVGYVGILCGYLLVLSIIDNLRLEESRKEYIYSPSRNNTLYVAIIIGLMCALAWYAPKSIGKQSKFKLTTPVEHVNKKS